MFAHIAKLGPAFFERTHSGEVMSRLTADTTQIKSAAGATLSQALRNCIMLVGALAMMFVTSARLSALVLARHSGDRGAARRLRPLWCGGCRARAQDTLAEASAYAAENLRAVRTMQAFGTKAQSPRSSSARSSARSPPPANACWRAPG